MADLRVNLCGVPLKNPVIGASGTFGYGQMCIRDRSFPQQFFRTAFAGLKIYPISAMYP